MHPLSATAWNTTERLKYVQFLRRETYRTLLFEYVESLTLFRYINIEWKVTDEARSGLPLHDESGRITVGNPDETVKYYRDVISSESISLTSLEMNLSGILQAIRRKRKISKVLRFFTEHRPIGWEEWGRLGEG